MQCEATLRCEPASASPSIPADPAAHVAAGAALSPAVAEWCARMAGIVACMNEQSGGILRLVAVDSGMLNHLLAHRDDGNPVAALTLALVSDALRKQAESQPDAPSCCSKCCRPLRPGSFQLVAVLPDCPDPASGLTVPICVDCGVTVEEVRAATWKVIEPIFGPVRVFGPQPDVVGHA